MISSIKYTFQALHLCSVYPLALVHFLCRKNLFKHNMLEDSIDTSKHFFYKAPSYHQSFVPYGRNNTGAPVDEKPNPVTIKVTEVITYEIPVDEKKFNEKKSDVR